MLGDSDLKLRTLAIDKGFDNEATYFGDKAKAAKLFGYAKAEQNANLARSLVNIIGRLDADKLGLGAELQALAKSPIVEVRSSISSCIAHSQGPSCIAIINALLEDSDRNVKRSAIGALSTGGITPGVPAVCTILTAQIARTDDLAGDALWAGSSSKCEGMDKAVIDELKKRTTDLSKVTNANGVGYGLAAGGVCSRTKAADLKKASAELLKKLTDPAVKDPNTRYGAIRGLNDCDATVGLAVARALSNDKEKSVAEEAKKIVAKGGKR